MITAGKSVASSQQVLTTTFENSWYWGMKSLFSDEQIAQIRRFCEQSKQESATVEGTDRENQVMRKNSVSWHNDAELYRLIQPALNYANSAAGWNYEITAIEPLQYTTYYGDNDHFTWHTDTIIRDEALSPEAPDGPLKGTIRKISCTIQLSGSDEYLGGDFELLSGSSTCESERDQLLKLEPIKLQAFREKGAALFFPSFTYHRVKPVTAGIRRALVCWFRGPKWR
jgi:PKHD-type hydroxylase